jgi:hypothetical protein
MRTSGVSVALAIGLTCLAAPALAQEQPDYAAAREHYRQATVAFDRGEFAIAAREFGIAYEITRDPILFYRIALAYEKAGDCEAALIYYRRYLKEGKPGDKERVDTEAHIAACEKTTGGTPPPPPPPPDPVETKPPPPGETTLAPDLGGGTEEPLPPPPGGQEIGSTPPPSFADQPGTWKRTGAWISVGIAVAAGTTAAVLGLSASSREEDIDNLIRFRNAGGQPAEYSGQTARRYEELIDEGERYEKYSLIALGVTGAAAAAATLLFILEAGEPDAPAGSTSAARFRLTPVVSADGAGLAAGWEF